MEEDSASVFCRDSATTFFSPNMPPPSPIMQNESFRQSLTGTLNTTMGDSQDFSLSSIITNFSRLLDGEHGLGNTSSSFLMHVEEKVETHTNTLTLIEGLDPAGQEVLRRMSEGYSSNSNFTPKPFGNSETNTPCPDGANGADSWDEFDKVMERSLPAKDWELIEFEVQSIVQECRSVLDVNDQFMSSEEAKKEMDKEEEFRAQFIQSDDATFVSLNNVSTVHPDPLSMSKYFEARSSFPVDNRANDSSMFGESCIEGSAKVLHSTMVGESDDYNADKTLYGLDPETVNRAGIVFEQIPRAADNIQKQNNSSTESIPTSAQSVQQFMMSSLSNGKSTEELTDYILKACRISNEFHSNGTINPPVVPEPVNLRKSTSSANHGPTLQAKVISRPKIVTSTPQMQGPNSKIKESSTTGTGSSTTVVRNTKVSFAAEPSYVPNVSVSSNAQHLPKSSSSRNESNAQSQRIPRPLPKVSKSVTEDSNRKSKESITTTTRSRSGPGKTFTVTGSNNTYSRTHSKSLGGVNAPAVIANANVQKSSTSNGRSQPIGLPLPKAAPAPVILTNVNIRKSSTKSGSSQTIGIPLAKIAKPQEGSSTDSNKKDQESNTSTMTGGRLNEPIVSLAPQPFQGQVSVSNNYCPPHPETFGAPLQQQGYSVPFAIHIHLPAFHPGMMYPYPPLPPNQPYDNSTQPQQQHQPHPSTLPPTYYHHPSSQQ